MISTPVYGKICSSYEEVRKEEAYLQEKEGTGDGHIWVTTSGKQIIGNF